MYLENPWLLSPQLNVHTKTVDPIIEGGAQVQQILNIECVSDFTDAPVLNIQFRLVSECIFDLILTYLATCICSFLTICMWTDTVELFRTLQWNSRWCWTSFFSPQRWHPKTSSNAGNSLERKAHSMLSQCGILIFSKSRFCSGFGFNKMLSKGEPSWEHEAIRSCVNRNWTEGGSNMSCILQYTVYCSTVTCSC